MSPNLIKWTKIRPYIEDLKEKALSRERKLLLRHVADLYQYETNFVAFPDGRLVVLVQIPLIVPSNQMKIFKYLPTPVTELDNAMQMVLDVREQFLAVNEQGTIYASLSEWEMNHKCVLVGDTHICKDLNILRKLINQLVCTIYL